MDNRTIGERQVTNYCPQCEVAGRRIAELVDVLRAVEWAVYVRGYGYTCPICGAAQDEGHDPDCRLAAMLRG